MMSPKFQALYKQFQVERAAPKHCQICHTPLEKPRRVICAACVAQGKHRELYWPRVVKQPRPCPYCGTTFTPHNNRQTHCSRKCAVKDYSLARSVRRGKPCQHCGSAMTGQARLYCDKGCRDAHYLQKGQ